MIAALLVTAAMWSAGVPCDYDCRWDRRWEERPASWRHWARRTARCETRGIPWRRKARAHDLATGYTYHGAVQFSLSTWRHAQRYVAHRVRRDPHRTSLHHQLTVAIELARHEGTGHWPVCG